MIAIRDQNGDGRAGVRVSFETDDGDAATAARVVYADRDGRADTSLMRSTDAGIAYVLNTPVGNHTVSVDSDDDACSAHEQLAMPGAHDDSAHVLTTPFFEQTIGPVFTCTD